MNRYRPGGFYRIDDLTGFKVRADDTAKQWDGLIVDRDEVDERNPQDFVRGRTDRQSVPDPRPEPAPIMLGDGAHFLVGNDGWRGWRSYQEYVGGSNAQFRAFSGFGGLVPGGSDHLT